MGLLILEDKTEHVPGRISYFFWSENLLVTDCSKAPLGILTTPKDPKSQVLNLPAWSVIHRVLFLSFSSRNLAMTPGILWYSLLSNTGRHISYWLLQWCLELATVEARCYPPCPLNRFDIRNLSGSYPRCEYFNSIITFQFTIYRDCDSDGVLSDGRRSCWDLLHTFG